MSGWAIAAQTAAKIADKVIDYNLTKGAPGAQKFSNDFNLAMYQRQLADQRMDAQRSIQWRVNDARNAGVHPLYALGAQGFQPSVSVGGTVGGGQSTLGGVAKDAIGGLVEGMTWKRRHAEKQIEQIQAQRDRNAQRQLLNAQAKYWRAKAGEVEKQAQASAIARAAQDKNTSQDTLRGAFGGVYDVPEHLNSVDKWEKWIGELADFTVGPANAYQIVKRRRKRLANVRRQVRAVKRHRAYKKYGKPWF